MNTPSDTRLRRQGYAHRHPPAAGPFNRPTNLAVGPKGDLFVSDGYGNCRVHRFSPTGELKRSWGTPGGRPGEFYLPHGIAVVGRRARLRLRPRERSHPDLQPGRRVPRGVDRHPAPHAPRVRRPGPRPRLRAVVARGPDLAAVTGPSASRATARVSVYDRDGTGPGAVGQRRRRRAPGSFAAPARPRRGLEAATST